MSQQRASSRTHRKTINNLSKKLNRFASLKNSNLVLRWILQLAAMTLSIASQVSPNSFIVFPSRRHRSNGLMTSFISHQISLNLRCLNLMAIINSERVEVTTQHLCFFFCRSQSGITSSQSFFVSFSRSVSSCNQLMCFCQIISSSSQLPHVVLSYAADVFFGCFFCERCHDDGSCFLQSVHH